MQNDTNDPQTTPIDDVFLRPSEIRELIIDTAICPYSFLQPGEPFFRIIDKIPKHVRDGLSQLKSEDIENDNWHLR